MWFGTYDGLVRYDGCNYKTYGNDPDDPHSLNSNDVLSILEDRHGILRVGIRYGLNELIKENNKFTLYKSNPDDAKSLCSNLV